MTDIVDTAILKALGLEPLRLATKEGGEIPTLDPSKCTPDCFSRAVDFCGKVAKLGQGFDVKLSPIGVYLKDLCYATTGYILHSRHLSEGEIFYRLSEEDLLQITDLIERFSLGYQASHPQ